MLIEDTLEHTKKMRFGKGEDLPEPVMLGFAADSQRTRSAAQDRDPALPRVRA